MLDDTAVGLCVLHACSFEGQGEVELFDFFLVGEIVDIEEDFFCAFDVGQFDVVLVVVYVHELADIQFLFLDRVLLDLRVVIDDLLTLGDKFIE